MIASLRKVSWTAGVPFRAVLIGSVKLYRAVFSSWLGGQCRFYPSCSHYAEEAIRTHGALRGTLMAFWRIARCGPFTEGGVDPVRPRTLKHDAYDAVLHSGMHS